MSRTIRYPIAIWMLSSVICCNEPVKRTDDSPVSGSIRISVDESFAPVLAEHVKTYMALYPGTRITAEYKPEAECLRDFFSDSSVRLVITGRGLTEKEDRAMRDSLNYAPGWNLLAFDAIALIVHPQSTDTLFSKEKLFAYLSGKVPAVKVVFDGLSATSTIRYLRDSIMKGSGFSPSSVFAARGSAEVIRYVASHPDAIGLVGISWLGNPEDSSRARIMQSVKIARVRCDLCEGTPFVLPSQESISTGRYPMTRGVYYIIRENYKGLGSGFVSFLKFEQGQLIFRRAYLRAVMDFDTRNVDIRSF